MTMMMLHYAIANAANIKNVEKQIEEEEEEYPESYEQHHEYSLFFFLNTK
jgi:hypothetical protein